MSGDVAVATSRNISGSPTQLALFPAASRQPGTSSRNLASLERLPAKMHRDLQPKGFFGQALGKTVFRQANAAVAGRIIKRCACRGGYPITQNYRVNDKIRSPKILLINEVGDNLGMVTLGEALKRAEEAGLDLVEVSPDKQPPVCRLLDYGKIKYQQKKKTQTKRKSQPQQKEVRFTPKIGEHDIQVKLKQIRQFIEHGDKVLVTMNFRGREIAHLARAKELVTRMATETQDVAKVEKEAKLEGRRMTMILVPAKN